MPLSTEVNLPRNHPARYPNRCVGCGENFCTSKLRLWTHTIGWWTAIFWIPGWGFSTQVPACRACGWKIRMQRIGGLLVAFAIAGLFLAFVWPHIDDFIPRALRKWVAVLLILICLLPYVLWETFWPPSIDITAFSNSVDYEFRDAEYAYEFAELNEDAEWVKIS